MKDLIINNTQQNKEKEADFNHQLPSLYDIGGLRLHVLGSGSQGNAAVIESTEGLILIDAGFSKKEIFSRMDALGLDLERALALIVTHEHSDHAKGVGVVSRGLKIPVYCTQGTASANLIKNEVTPHIIHSRDKLKLHNITISTFPTHHDAQEPIGMSFVSDDGDAIGYVTDTGMLSHEAMELLHDSRLLAIESNYDEAMLQQGPYPTFLKARIRSSTGHLSNNDARDALLGGLITNRTETVIGMHLSQTNNAPRHSKSALSQTCTINGPKIETAGQNIPRSFI